jgi:hypothetical protein
LFLVHTPVSDNKVLVLTFLITLILHLGLMSPLSQWLDQILLPRFADDALEIDINEIRSNQSLEKEKQPFRFEEKRTDPVKIPQKGEVQELVPPVREHPRMVPGEKKKLSFERREEVKTVKDESQERTGQKKVLVEQKPESALLQSPHKAVMETTDLDETSTTESIISPLVIPETNRESGLRKKESGTPDEVRGSFRNGTPENTKSENLQYSMNSYQWTFKRFVDNWVVDIQRWWKAPIDYITGKMPEGGDLWVQVQLGLSGKLQSYRIIRSNVTPEMELRAIQALIGSLKRPEIPPSFSKETLVINWRFIYPPLRPPIKMKR